MDNNISKNELKNISVEFRNIASRLLQTSYGNDTKDLERFIYYIESTPFILGYIKNCCKEDYDFDKINNLQKELPISKEGEISYLYQLLKYICNSNQPYHAYALGMYNGKLQNAIDKFGAVFIQPLVNHIGSYLSQVFTELGYENGKGNGDINIQGNISQLNYARDEGNINASNIINNIPAEFYRLIEEFIQHLKEENIPDDQKEEITDLIEIVKEQSLKEKPKRGLLKIAADKMNQIHQVVDKGGKLAGIIMKLYPFIQAIISNLPK